MLVNCVICSDLFLPTSEVYTTTCGHIFHYSCLLNWLERSKSCPQCRSRVTERNIYRIYFNVSNNETLDDSSVLQQKLDDLNLKWSLQEKAMKLVTEKYRKAKDRNAGLRLEIQSLEQKEASKISSIQALKDQVSYFKSKVQNIDKLHEEMKQLRDTIRSMEKVSVAINGSKDEVNDMLKNPSSVETLVLMVATLKKSLVDADKRKQAIEHKTRFLQTEHMRVKKELNIAGALNEELRKEIESLRNNHECERMDWDKKEQSLRDKLEKLCSASKSSSQESENSSQNEQVNSSTDVVIIKDDFSSPSVEENAKIVNSSDSPYLQLKCSSVGFNSYLNKKISVTRPARSSQYGMFRKTPDKVTKPSDVFYNGLGSSSKEEIYPTHRLLAGNKRPRTYSTVSSTKFRKLAPISKNNAFYIKRDD